MSSDSWEKFARSDPYWAVLTDDRYKGSLDAAARESFFQSGSAFVDMACDNIKRHFGRTIAEADAAIDFGCGVGRLTLPMARICHRVAGIDVSETMRKECLRNARRMGQRNIQCHEGPEELAAGVQRFNWLNSYIVFQHIEARQGYRLFDSLLRLMAPDAVISVHFTLFKDKRHAHYMTNSLGYFSVDESGVTDYHANGDYYPADTMMMNDYRLDRLVQILHSHGFRRHFIEMEDHDGMHGAVVYSVRDR